MRSTIRPQNPPLELSNSVDLLQNRAKKVADQSLQSTQRMVGMVDESKEVGLRTLVELEQQGERLNLLHDANKEIRDEIRESEKILTEMEKCCGLFVLPWKIPKSPGRGSKAWKKSKQEKVVSEQPHRAADEETFPDGMLPRITNDSGEEEMESNLSHVHSTVRDLKGLAATMRNEARAHNQNLDRLIIQADSNDQRVQSAYQRTEQLHH